MDVKNIFIQQKNVNNFFFQIQNFYGKLEVETKRNMKYLIAAFKHGQPPRAKFEHMIMLTIITCFISSISKFI